MSKIYDNGIYREMTAEEIAKSKEEQKKYLQSFNYGELVESYIREKYSISAEFAILRQRDTKPKEFEEYNAYAEKCKAKAKEIFLNRGENINV